MARGQQVDVVSRNAVTIAGTGPPILLVHGFGCDQAMWNPMAPELQGDHQVIQYDLTGMGASDYHAYDRQRHGNLAGHAADLIEVVEAVGAGPVVAVGHSVSAMIIALAAIERPDLFRALVMLSPSPRYIDDPPYIGGFSEADIRGLLGAMRENYQGWAGQLASMVAGEQETDAVEGELNDRFCRNDPEISRHFARVTFLSDNRADLAKIRTPTLIVHCKADAIAPPSVSAYVHEHVPGSRIVAIDGSGHAPHMTHPKRTTKAIRSFLQGLG